MSTPALVPAAAVIAGAALGTWAGDAASLPGLACLLVACGLLAVGFLANRSTLFLVGCAGVFLSTSMLLGARASQEAREPALRASLGGVLGQGPMVVEGRLREDAVPAGDAVGLSVDVEAWTSGGVRHAVKGGARLLVTGSMAAGRLDEWRAGRPVRVPALLREPGRYQDPGVPDARLGLARKGIAVAGTVKSGALVEVLGRGHVADEAAAALRHFARQAVARHVGSRSPQAGAIVIAILIGDRAGLDDEVQRRLQEAGTYHVIAISGGNIAILATVLMVLLRMARAGPRSSSWITMALLAGYAVVVGGGASVTRATVMASLYLLARQADHRSAPLNALAVAAATLVLATPSDVSDVAFWLTFGATLGIVAGVELVGRRLPRAFWLQAPAALLLSSVCAELALLPVAARVFSRVTFAGLLLNFAAIPLMSVAQIAGMAVVTLAGIWPAAAGLAGRIAGWAADGLVSSAGLVGWLPWLAYRLPPPHALTVAAYYVTAVCWLWLGCLLRARGASGTLRRARLMVLACWVACAVWVLVEPVTLLAPGVSGRLRVTMLDVGHGDAILVQLPDRRSLLVDTGGSLRGGSYDIGGRVVAPALWALGTRRLDVLVLTHADPDHAGGMASVLRDFRPREIWEGIPVPPLESLLALRSAAALAGVPWIERRAGDRIGLGDVSLRIVHPQPPDWERQKVRNDDSLVIEARYGDVSIVLPGDIGRDVERELLPCFEPARLRVLKVPHHGSVTSSTSAFLAALGPRVALLSAGTATRVNPEVLGRYRDVGAALYRTDVHGAITVETDGRTLRVTTETGLRAVFAR